MYCCGQKGFINIRSCLLHGTIDDVADQSHLTVSGRISMALIILFSLDPRGAIRDCFAFFFSLVVRRRHQSSSQISKKQGYSQVRTHQNIVRFALSKGNTMNGSEQQQDDDHVASSQLMRQKLMSADECYIYKIPPLRDAGGHRCVVIRYLDSTRLLDKAARCTGGVCGRFLRGWCCIV